MSSKGRSFSSGRFKAPSGAVLLKEADLSASVLPNESRQERPVQRSEALPAASKGGETGELSDEWTVRT